MRKKHYTTVEAAQIANCHSSTILRLVHQEKFKIERTSEKARVRFLILNNRKEIREIVSANAKNPGWHKNSKPKSSSSSKSELSEVLKFIALNREIRAILLKLSEKFNLNDLKIISEL